MKKTGETRADAFWREAVRVPFVREGSTPNPKPQTPNPTPQTPNPNFRCTLYTNPLAAGGAHKCAVVPRRARI